MASRNPKTYFASPANDTPATREGGCAEISADEGGHAGCDAIDASSERPAEASPGMMDTFRRVLDGLKFNERCRFVWGRPHG